MKTLIIWLSMIFIFSLTAFSQESVNEEMGFIEVDKEIRLFYQKIGKGKQTVLVPLHLFMFEDFKHLAKNKTFIFYDVRNRGRSTAIADGSKISIQEDVEDIERIRQHFKLNKITLIGESYCGLMAIMYALKYPNNVERIVQIGAAARKFGTEYPKEFQPNDETPVPPKEKLTGIEELRKRDYHRQNPRDFCEKERSVRRFALVGNPANASKIRDICHLENEWAVNQDRHWTHHFASWQNLEISKEEIAKVTIPVLTIHGTKDRHSFYGAGREWATLLPNARLLTVKGAAHLPWLDEPELIFSAIQTFLSGKFPKEAVELNELITKPAC